MSCASRMNSPYRDWKLPNVESVCTYHETEQKQTDSPHVHRQFMKDKPKILSDILQHIGSTPMVKINAITRKEAVECEILAKCEFYNAAGSVKDRVAYRMVIEAEARGILKPGDTLIEPTSGNTGIGLALVSAVKGYRCIIVMPEKMSLEKVDILRALGAEIVRTPTTAAYDSPESHIGVARRLMEDLPNSHILDQYRNMNNPLAHYDGTAEEIIDACDGKLDMVVVTAGTGGTLTGIGRKIREKCPNCKIIGVDPEGSIIAQPEQLNEIGVKSYQVEGIGYDFIPTVCDRKVVDKWYKSSDKDSLVLAKRMIKEEGLLCGGSSGAVMSCALQAIRDFGLKKGDRCVVLLPDSIRNYMTKHLSDDWMISFGFMDPDADVDNPLAWWWNLRVSSLSLAAPMTVGPNISIEDTLLLLNKEGFDQVPVVDEAGRIQGMVTVGNMMSQIVKGRVKGSDSVSQVTYKQFKQLSMGASLRQLSKMLDTDHFVLVVHDQRQYNEGGQIATKSMIFGIATRIDLVNFITKHGKDMEHPKESEANTIEN